MRDELLARFQIPPDDEPEDVEVPTNEEEIEPELPGQMSLFD